VRPKRAQRVKSAQQTSKTAPITGYRGTRLDETRCKERFIRKIRANFNKLLELICDGILKHTVPRACQDFTATTMPIIIRAIPTKYCG
jgi:hypothetical protein